MTKIELSITQTLRDLEIPVHMAGYRYIRTAVEMLIADPDLIGTLSGDYGLYALVAAKHATSEAKVERNIRHAKEQMQGDKDTQKRILGRARHMPNAEFLGAIAEYLRMEGVA